MNWTMFKLGALGALLACASHPLSAQCIQGPNGRPINPDGSDCANTVSTVLPFLRITPDARFGAMGDAGIALSPDPNSMHFNASSLAFATSDVAVAPTYTPWLRALQVNDIFLTYLSGYKNIDKFQTLGMSLRYFSLGQIQFTDDQGNPLQQARPRELELSFAYARKLGKYFSSGLTAKYIYSNLGSGTTASGAVMRPAHAFAVDLSFTYRKPMKIKGKEATIAAGLAFSNVGNKISYVQSANRDYLPSNVGLGGSFEYNFDEHNSLTVALDINKLMVPTPVPRTMTNPNDPDGPNIVNPEYDANSNGVADYKEKSVPAAIFSSFSDASFREEMRELMYSFGLEYWYNKQFALRMGHYNENRYKGNRKYVTVGVGIKYNILTINFSYLIPAIAAQRNPLDNTLRFALIFDLKRIPANKSQTPPTPQ